MPERAKQAFDFGTLGRLSREPREQVASGGGVQSRERHERQLSTTEDTVDTEVKTWLGTFDPPVLGVSVVESEGPYLSARSRRSISGRYRACGGSRARRSRAAAAPSARRPDFAYASARLKRAS